MTLDLAQFHAVSFSFDTYVTLSDDAAKKLEIILGKPTNQWSTAAQLRSNYQIRNTWYSSAVIIHQHGDPGNYHVVFIYDKRPRETKVSPTPTSMDASVVLKELSALGGEKEFEANGHFIYEDSTTRPLFKFPIPLFESQSLPFDDIIGIRVAKKLGNNVLYTVIIDTSARRKEFHITVQLGSVKRMFGETLPRELFETVVSIAAKFLTE